MRMTTIARFMQMNGAISGWRDGVRWLRLPAGKTGAMTTVLGYQNTSRGGLRICSTVSGGVGGYKLRDAHASSCSAR